MDSQSPKALFNVSSEFYQSSAAASLSIQFDQGVGFTVADSFKRTAVCRSCSISLKLPAIISSTASKYGHSHAVNDRFREVQIVISSPAGKLSLRSLSAKAFADTIPPEQ